MTNIALYDGMDANMNGGDEFILEYLRPDLKAEYSRLTKLHPDIPELAPPLINVSDVFRAYFILADYFTDQSSADEVERMLVGLRDYNLLASALGRQYVCFGGKQKYDNAIDICSTLFFGMVKNHAFSDGNKRTALLILLYQLYLCGYIPSTSEKEFERLVVSVAANTLSIDYHEYKKFKKADDPEIKTISYLLRHNMVKKKDHSYHVSPTTKEFCAALERHKVTSTLSSGKLHFSREIKPIGFFAKKKTASATIPFGGWTRTIGAQTARDSLKKLELYEEYSSYQDFIEGKEPMYNLVNQFSVPLRCLKDK